MLKIEKMYLDVIIEGKKNYEIRKLEEDNEYFQDIILGKENYLNFCEPENELKFKCKYIIKGAFIAKFKDVPFGILENVFESNKPCYYGSDIGYDLQLVEDGIKPLKDSLALKEMQRFYGKDFSEDTEVIIFHLDN